MALHPFEARGLGKAPFAFVGLSDNARNVAGVLQIGGCCDYCHTGIRYECRIKSSDGKYFVVGTDCVRKLDREDNKLVKEVERAVHQLEVQKREEKRQAEEAVRRAAHEVKLQEQRERNGGLTDYEVAEQARIEQERVRREAHTAENAWLLNVLNEVHYGSDFITSMIAELSYNSITSLSGRCIQILASIYAKQVSGSRSNSKKYAAVEKDFYARIEDKIESGV